MFIDKKSLERIVLGFISLDEEDGYISIKRFSKTQRKFYDELSEGVLMSRVDSTASVKMEFYTCGGEVSFDFKILPGTKREYYSIDLLEDGYYRYNFSEEKNETENNFKYTISFSENPKRITIYFPTTAVMQIKNVNLPDDYTPHKRNKTVLVLGDSGIQGYNPMHFQNTYINMLSDYFDVNLINQAVGGQIFRSEVAEKTVEDPYFIMVSYGINDWVSGRLNEGKNARELVLKLKELYPTKKIFFVLPMNHNYLEKKRENDDITMSYEKTSDVSTIEDVRNILYNATKDIENVIFINAKEFAPQYEECFSYDNVHFTDLGNILYGNELIKAIESYIKEVFYEKNYNN